MLVEARPLFAPGPRPTSGPLCERLHADIAIVGAGPAGLAAALTLVGHDLEVVLLEAEALGAQGESLGPGVALPGLGEHYDTICNSLGQTSAHCWFDLSLEGVAALEGWLEDSQRGGLLELAVNQAELEEMTRGIRAMTEDGFQARMMSEAAATNLVSVDGNVGATYLPGALTFDPALALQRLGGLFVARGGRLFEISRVERLGLDEGAGVVLHTERGQVEAEVALLAPGAGLNELVGPGMDRLVFPLRGQCLATAPAAARLEGSTVVVSANRSHEIYRSLKDGGFLAAGINPNSGWDEKTYKLEVDRAFQSYLEKTMHERLPETRGLEVTHRWAKIYNYTADGLPLLGPMPGDIRFHLATGFATRSWSTGVGAGQMLARMLLGETVRFPHGCSPRRFL
ncbi:FAD-binding oxidoreductase [bacterium CPR1]|nr:FAD-binding oxidoreductase [bacterium CPR1]